MGLTEGPLALGPSTSRDMLEKPLPCSEFVPRFTEWCSWVIHAGLNWVYTRQCHLVCGFVSHEERLCGWRNAAWGTPMSANFTLCWVRHSCFSSCPTVGAGVLLGARSTAPFTEWASWNRGPRCPGASFLCWSPCAPQRYTYLSWERYVTSLPSLRRQKHMS